jgi:hypothetical protein
MVMYAGNDNGPLWIDPFECQRPQVSAEDCTGNCEECVFTTEPPDDGGVMDRVPTIIDFQSDTTWLTRQNARNLYRVYTPNEYGVTCLLARCATLDRAIRTAQSFGPVEIRIGLPGV